MRNFGKMFLLLGVMVPWLATAQELTMVNDENDTGPVVIYGSANENNGRKNTFILEQTNEENPLGNPIETYPPAKNDVSESNVMQPILRTNAPPPIVSESLPQNPKISARETPQIVDKQIQNTLYESGGRTYDIQSYPDADIKYIQQPNLNPTITTYPAY